MHDVPMFVHPENPSNYKTFFQMWLRRHPVAREKWTRLDSLRDKVDLALSSQHSARLTVEEFKEANDLFRWFETHNVRPMIATVAMSSR